MRHILLCSGASEAGHALIDLVFIKLKLQDGCYPVAFVPQETKLVLESYWPISLYASSSFIPRLDLQSITLLILSANRTCSSQSGRIALHYSRHIVVCCAPGVPTKTDEFRNQITEGRFAARTADSNHKIRHKLCCL